MKIERTERGFQVARFKDRYDSECSIQNSSLASEDAIWLGVDKGFDGKECTRMHLTRKMVKELLPLLKDFVEHGSIDSSTESDGGVG